MKFLSTVVVALVVGFIGGYVAQLNQTEQVNPIETYYTASAATLVSPHHLRVEMDKGNDHYLLVDVRTKAEYEEEHITGAVNIDASQTREQIVEAFRSLQAENLDKEIVIYCYSAACMTGRKLGAALAEEDVYVKEMTIGWNEWRYDFMSWNYPDEWDNLDPERYVISGTEPGILPPLEGTPVPACDIEGEFGC